MLKGWVFILSKAAFLSDFYHTENKRRKLKMVSDASKKKAAAKKAAAAAKRSGKTAEKPNDKKENGSIASSSTDALDRLEKLQLGDRTCTGTLASHPLSRDIHVRKLTASLFSCRFLIGCLSFQIESFSLTFHGHELVSDTSLELNYGR